MIFDLIFDLIVSGASLVRIVFIVFSTLVRSTKSRYRVKSTSRSLVFV